MKTTLTVLIWVIAGGLTLAGTGKDAPGTYEKESRYDVATTVDHITEAASEAGWVLPGDHDMQATLKKGGKEVLPSTIVVLCNGGYAYKFLKDDEMRKVQSLLPCRVAVYEKSDGKTYIAWSNYKKKGKEFGKPAASVFEEIHDDLEDIMATVVK
ncbi:MAG: DUF302 domain-containing protein [Marinilabilia sp.]